MEARHGPPRRGAPAAALLTLVALCAAPHAAFRLTSPSLFADDVVRIEQVRTMSVPAMLARPFNEHLAPLFDLVTVAAWRACGGRLTAAPWAFTAASLVPSALSALVLARLVRREAGSEAAGLGASALFALSAVDIETFWWYSASSFTWALLGTLAAWSGAARGGRLGAAIAGVGALAAPAFSGVGLLAGPVAAARAIGGGVRRPRLVAASAAVGTIAYLAAGLAFRHQDAVTESVRHNADLAGGLVSACRAPFVALLPGLIGLRRTALDRRLPAGLDVFLAVGAIAGILLAARRHPRRPMLLGGLLLIAGGYALIYPFRVELSGGAYAMRGVQRYHLFPRVGLVLLLAGAAAPAGRRLDARPAGRWGAVALAALALLVHHRAMKDWGRYYAFRDQPATLAAIERLGRVCTREGITHAQALAALDPIRTRWTPAEGFNPLRMLGPGAPGPRVPDASVRTILLSSLPAPDREALCGGMDASPYLRPAGEYPDEVAVGRLVRFAGIRPDGSSTVHIPAFLEYDLAPEGAASARALVVPGDAPDRTIELWWADARGAWSPTRSIFWRAEAGGRSAIPFDRLPHWDASRARRLRVVLRKPGPVALGEPRLVR